MSFHIINCRVLMHVCTRNLMSYSVVRSCAYIYNISVLLKIYTCIFIVGEFNYIILIFTVLTTNNDCINHMYINIHQYIVVVNIK